MATGISGITGWKFVDGQGNEVQRSTDVSSIKWSGIVATMGTVRVSSSDTDQSAVITVRPRNWHIDPAATADQKPNGYFWNLPVPPQPTGSDAGLGHYRFIANYSGSATQTIPDGPNKGYTYFTEPINFSSGLKAFEYEINPDLENSTSDFSLHQCELDGYISWQHLYDGTRRHEYNSDTDSHYANYKQAWNAHNGGDYLEQQVAIPSQNISDWLNSLTQTLAGYYAESGTIANLTAVEPSPVNQVGGQDLYVNFKDLGTGAYPHSCP